MKKICFVAVAMLFTRLGFAQPTVVNISLTKDAVITNASSGSNYGTAGQFNVYWSGSVYRTFLQADFTSIPNYAIVRNAKLYLYCTANDFSAAQSILLCRSNASWDESSGTPITYTNQPTFSTGDAAAFTTPTSANAYHSLSAANFTTHVQLMVNYPALNNGWCLKMASESGSTRGLTYKSKEASSNLPYIEVTYILPIEVSGTVTHCSEGHDDGSITNIVATEGTESYANYQWYKYEMGTVTSLGSGSSLTSMTGLSDGLYLVKVTDSDNFIGYQYFLIGEENTTTTVEFSNSDNTNSGLFNEDAYLQLASGSGIAPNGSSTNIEGLKDASNTVYSVLKYKVNFDSRLEYTLANLCLVSGGHYRESGNSNSGKVKRVTANWYESIVTWNTQPSVTTTNEVSIAQTSTSGTVSRNDTINMLNFVQYWSANPSNNYGVMLEINTSGTGTRRLRYYSYDYSTHANRPKLVLTYTLSEPTNYFGLSESLQGSYYRVTDDLLRVKYTEEYLDQDGALTYRIRNAAGTIVMDQTDETQLITYGDNRMRIDVSSLSNGFYTFELTNEKNEKWYLRFEVA